MLKIKSKDYDLSSLFQYDLLREILLSLAEFQNDINSEIKSLRNYNKIQDIRLSRLEEKNDIIFDPSEFNINISNYESSPIYEAFSDDKNKEDKDKDKDKDEKNEEEISKDKDDKNIFGEGEKDDDDDDEEGPKKKKTKSKFDNLLNVNKNTNKINNISSNNNNNLNNLNNVGNMGNIDSSSTSTSQATSQLNLDLIRNMMKNIRENTEKITELESQLSKSIERQLKKSKEDLKKDANNQILEFKSTFNIFDNRINEIMKKNSEQDKIIEDLSVKSSNFDIFNMFRDSGDGSVDMAKVLVKALEEKVFKKFELVDLRYKQESNEFIKIKKAVENMNPVLEKCEREINDLKDGEQKIKEDIDNIKELIETNNKKYNGLIEDNKNEFNQMIVSLKNDFETLIKEKDNDLNNKIREGLKNVNSSDMNSKDHSKLNMYDEDTISMMEKKINDVRKKTNDLDNTFRCYMKDFDINEIKKEIKDLQSDMEQKLTRDSLKELYNLHLSDAGEISEIREHISTLFDDMRKNAKSTTVLTNKLESVVGSVLSLQERKIGPQKQIIDFSKYVDNTKLNDVINSFNNKIEKIYGEIDSLRRDLTEMEIESKEYEKKDRVNRLEDDVYKHLNETKSSLHKAKMELNKLIRGIELQIKSLTEEVKQKQDAYSWILGKQPLKCFNCATCEANIRNENPSEEYISWNKYPAQHNKNARFGRGFSHMLQMMTYDFLNNDNNKNNTKEQYVPLADDFNGNEQNSNISNKNNNSQIIENIKYSTHSKIAQIERSASNILNKHRRKEIGKLSVPKNSGKLKLPKMIENKKSKNEEIDDEKHNINANESYNERVLSNDNESPSIIKIIKKKGNTNINSYINSPKNVYNISKDIHQNNSNSRQKSVDNQYDKRFSQTIPIP